MQVVGNYNVTDRFTGVLNSNFCGENAGSCSSNGYDDAGETMYKMQLSVSDVRTNRFGGMNLDVEKIMYYPNGYININQNGEYTKHYYADALRVASKIGSGSDNPINCNADSLQSANTLEVMKKELGIWLTGDTVENINCDFDTIKYLTGDGNTENGLYFYHGNHLNSTALITDYIGNVQQAVLYTPFGQVISEYRQDWMLDTIPRYLFTGSERDAESGMDYMNARYYSSDWGGFISRDALFEKYFWMSPYSYCLNSPLRWIDPTGMGPNDPPLLSSYLTTPTTGQVKVPYALPQKTPQSTSGGTKPTSSTTTQTTSGTKPASTGNKVSTTVKNAASAVGSAASTAWEAFKKFDASIEGGADGANRGTITKKDAIVGGSIAGGLALLVVAPAAVPVIAEKTTAAVASATPKIIETTIKAYEIGTSPPVQGGIGVGIGLFNKDIPPDMLYPSPYMQIGSEAGQLYKNFYKNFINQGNINKQDTTVEPTQ